VEVEMELDSLSSGAAAVAFLHTVLGPDHYVPLLAIGAALKWRWPRVLLLTLACGFAHVLSSIVLGLVGAGVGAAVSSVEVIQEHAGSFAGWGLVVVGGAYALWGLYAAAKGIGHAHLHVHPGGKLHVHQHRHLADDAESSHRGGHHTVSLVAPWAIFLIFAFGPCEPLIAYTFTQGLQRDYVGLAVVSVVFGLVTLLTMVVIVMIAYLGLVKLRAGWLQRYIHFLAGLAIAVSGLAMTVLGL